VTWLASPRSWAASRTWIFRGPTVLRSHFYTLLLFSFSSPTLRSSSKAPRIFTNFAQEMPFSTNPGKVSGQCVQSSWICASKSHLLSLLHAQRIEAPRICSLSSRNHWAPGVSTESTCAFCARFWVRCASWLVSTGGRNLGKIACRHLQRCQFHRSAACRLVAHPKVLRLQDRKCQQNWIHLATRAPHSCSSEC